MSTIPSISASFITRPQAPAFARPAGQPQRAEGTSEANPVREPDRVDLSPVARDAIEPVEAVERSDIAPASELSSEELEQVRELKARDAEVKTHEQAHVAAAGPHYRSGPTYTYQKGPDGNRYAVGGSVQIDTSPVAGDPKATIAKAQQVRRAALAPAEPSTTDQQVASAASRMEAQARRELAEEQAADAEATGAIESSAMEDDANIIGAAQSRSAEGTPLDDKGQPKGNALDITA